MSINKNVLNKGWEVYDTMHEYMKKEITHADAMFKYHRFIKFADCLTNADEKMYMENQIKMFLEYVDDVSVRGKAYELLKMDEIICNYGGSESVWGAWIEYGIADGDADSKLDDAFYIASDDEQFAEVCELYKELKAKMDKGV